MIKKVDLGAAMGSFAQATDAEFVYGELADGSQVKIKKSDLLDVLFQNRGTTHDANSALNMGIYRINSPGIANIPYSGYGILITFNTNIYVSQLYLYGEGIKQRKSADQGVNWTNWS